VSLARFSLGDCSKCREEYDGQNSGPNHTELYITSADNSAEDDCIRQCPRLKPVFVLWLFSGLKRVLKKSRCGFNLPSAAKAA
jgi:hypothetical protein